MKEASLPEDELPPREAEGAPAPRRVVNEVSWWRYLLLMPLSWLARVWCATLRFEITEQEQALLSYHAKPIILATWHNRLFIAGEVCRRYRKEQKLVALVSASKDGAWLTAFFKLVGIDAARGSSSWRGMQALREMLAVGKSGADIGITPDGPRGPCYELKPGVLLLAKLSHAPMILYCARFRSAWRLRSWDRFYLPKPFSIVEINVRFLPGYESLDADGETAVRELRRQFMEITFDS
ncbi:MAG TPA: lysophospholipid acyltransferase family protein [Opitutales bacterium]|nr:lysophospholipid acyltransferase family protein [Opitutales bacterium]